MVPSQCEEEESECSGERLDYETNSDSIVEQGKDTYNDFKHLYESTCKMTDAAGPQGRRNLMDGLNEIRAKNIKLLGGGIGVSGMGTLPVSSRKIKDHGKKKATSPQKQKPTT